MTTFDLFQLATCEIATGNKESASKLLSEAIAEIDRTGIDANMRSDIFDLLEAIS